MANPTLLEIYGTIANQTRVALQTLKPPVLNLTLRERRKSNFPILFLPTLLSLFAEYRNGEVAFSIYLQLNSEIW
jgi:hypothetical protein